MKIIIVRHGETEENVKKIIQGHIQGNLTSLGIEQAKKVAERLKDEKIDTIFSSDLKRAVDTTNKIIKFHPDISLELRKDVRERYLGKLQGKRLDDFNFKEDDKTKITEEAGAEKIEDLVERAGNFIKDILEGHYGKNILLVTHGGFISAINSKLLNEDWVKMHSENKPKNTCLTIYEFDKNKKPKLILDNCVKHLDN